MPRIFLGPTGSETDLPGLKYIGNAPAWPVSTKKQATKAKMSDGSYRWAFFGTKKGFKIRFGYLTNAELTIFKDLNALNQILRYMNQFEEGVWYEVVISDFTHDPERMDARQLDRYKISLTLEEI